MMPARRRIFLLLLGCFFVCWGNACSATAALPTAVIPLATVHLSPTPIATETAVPTYTPEQTAPLLPTSTPLPTATPCPSGYIENGTMESVFAGTFRYRVYVPPCYRVNGRSYPILYLLPGNIHSDSIWDDLGLDEIAETGIQDGNYPPFLIAMADGGWIANNTSGGYGSYESVILDEFMPHIESQYCTWGTANGRAIGGISRGGYWSLEIAFQHPDQFLSVGGHSAALYDIGADPALNPQYTGLNQNLGKLRVYMDIGEQDVLIPNLRRLHEDMVAADVLHEWHLNSGGHDNAYWMAHLEEYLDWYLEPWQGVESVKGNCP